MITLKPLINLVIKQEDNKDTNQGTQNLNKFGYTLKTTKH
jgi:hypothetical protein